MLEGIKIGMGYMDSAVHHATFDAEE